MVNFQRFVVALPGRDDLLETVYTLLEKHNSINHFAYERNGTWHIGLGSYASLFISANGKEAKTSSQGKPSQTVSVNETITDIARHFVSQYKYLGGKIFGQAGFNYGCHVRNQDYPPGRWPIFSLMVPITEITLSASQITIQGHDEKVVTDACDWIKNASAVHVRDAQPLSTLQNEEEHKSNVRIVLKEIAAGEYTKIIMSRAVDLEGRVDMLAILYHGRRGNTPARAFTMNHGGFEATGFSPELVVAVENGKVVTEPLAGTTSRIGTEQEVETPGNRLINNDKEIVEHVISVKEAITELNRLCPRKTVAIEDLMVIKQRGSVQHLGSRVTGRLSSSLDAWSAFNIVFPSITAAGIPKDVALRAISRIESRPRELYSGSVFLLDGDGKDFFEATLCLRTVFQDTDKQWIQAGAGVISQSNPERELTETAEKLASIAPFIVYESKEK